MRTYLKIKADLAMLMLTCVLPLAVAAAAYVAYDHGLIAGWFMAWIAFSAGLMSWVPRLDDSAGKPASEPTSEAREPSRVGESR
jgi:hypothetical protein